MSPASIPKPPAYVGISSSRPISIVKYATVSFVCMYAYYSTYRDFTFIQMIGNEHFTIAKRLSPRTIPRELSLHAHPRPPHLPCL